MSGQTTTRVAPTKTNSGFFLSRFNLLDWVLLAICALAGVWLYHRST
ncbi:MAG: amino acid ABC transporter permease, partial [Pseudomonadota bacterium]